MALPTPSTPLVACPRPDVRFPMSKRWQIYLQRDKFPRGYPQLFRLGKAVLKFTIDDSPFGKFLKTWELMQDVRDALRSEPESPTHSLPHHIGPDPHSLAWRWVDHSEPSITWSTVTDPGTIVVLKKVMSNYAETRPGTIYDALSEGTTTRNFRVVPPGKTPRFLKLHLQGVTPRKIQSMRSIATAVRAAELFEPWFAEGLTPIPNKAGKLLTPVDHSWNEPQGAQRVTCAEVFELLHAVAHFSGDDVQLTSFAQKLGQLQSLLSQCGDLLEEDSRFAIAYTATYHELFHAFTLIDTVFRLDDDAQTMNPAFPYWKTHRLELRKGLQSVKAFLEREHEVGTYLHDVHPHNTLFAGSKCVLIYDYERFARFPHGEVTAYALHRFVREIVRKQYVDHSTEAHRYIAPSVDAFIDAYRQFGPPLPASFRDDIAMWIRVSALRKVVSILKGFALNRDEAARPAEKRIAELKKFLGYLSEADFFEASLGSSSRRIRSVA